MPLFFASSLPAVDENWIAAAYTPSGDRSGPMQAALVTSDRLIDQLVRADAIASGFPIITSGSPRP